MTKRDRIRLYAIRLLIDGKSTIKDTAEALALSERQVKRLKAGVKKYGDGFVVHKNRERKPSHTIPDETRERIIALAKGKYKGANFTHFTELLAEHEGIVVSQPTVARILASAGIKSPRKHRPPKGHRTRERKPKEGELIQMDASPHEWIAKATWSLHGAVDDATGKINGLCFFEEECLDGYFAVTRQMLERFGVPVSIYADRHSIFHSPKDAKRSLEDELLGRPKAYTQFSRACSELGISLIAAYSPQAKGRVERLWGTLQDRLTLEMRLAGIRTIEDANLFLPTFIDRFNLRFSVAPGKAESAWRSLEVDIDTVLVRKIARKVDNGSVFTYQGTKYQMVRGETVLSAQARSIVTLHVGSEGATGAEYEGVLYGIKACIQPAKKDVKESKESRKGHTPAPDHPWKSALPRGPRGMRDNKVINAMYYSQGIHR